MNVALERKKAGLSGSDLRLFGFAFLCAGAVGKAVFENALIGEGGLESQSSMTYAAIALFLQAASACAVPIYVFLLFKGFESTKDIKKYFLWLCALALASELPYNLVTTGRLFDLTDRNPVFALILCLAMLYYFRRYEKKCKRNTALKAIVALAAFSWAILFTVADGVACIIFCIVLYATRKKESILPIAGAAALSLCTLYSPLYSLSPLSLVLLHFHNGDKGAKNPLANYLSYPVMLLCVGTAARFI